MQSLANRNRAYNQPTSAIFVAGLNETNENKGLCMHVGTTQAAGRSEIESSGVVTGRRKGGLSKPARLQASCQLHM